MAGYQIYGNFIQPGAVYYPTKNEVVEEMIRLSKVGPKDRLVDLGSGDGRIIIAAAKLGARAVGYEINPLLVIKSRKLIRKEGLEKLAKVEWKSLWKVNFKGVSVVSVYLMPNLMKKLEKLIRRKTDKPLRVISNDYQFPELKPSKRKGNIFLYEFKRLDQRKVK